MTTFRNFRQAAPIDIATIAACEAAPGFPPAILEAWREHGAGFVGEDGMVRLLDPRQYTPKLGRWLEGTQGAICFGATGLGDLFIWRAGVIFWVVFRTGHIQALRPDPEKFLAAWEHPAYLDEIVWRQRYLEAVARWGRPGIEEAFYYTPFLLMGGVDDADHMDVGQLEVTLDIFSGMFGKASLDEATGL